MTHKISLERNCFLHSYTSWRRGWDDLESPTDRETEDSRRERVLLALLLLDLSSALELLLSRCLELLLLELRCIEPLSSRFRARLELRLSTRMLMSRSLFRCLDRLSIGTNPDEYISAWRLKLDRLRISSSIGKWRLELRLEDGTSVGWLRLLLRDLALSLGGRTPSRSSSRPLFMERLDFFFFFRPLPDPLFQSLIIKS